MPPVDVLYATQIEVGVDALRESDATNFLKPNGQSRNLNIYAWDTYISKYCSGSTTAAVKHTHAK